MEKLPTGAPTDGFPYALKPGYYDSEGNHTDAFSYENSRGYGKGRHPDDDDDDDDDDGGDVNGDGSGRKEGTEFADKKDEPGRGLMQSNNNNNNNNDDESKNNGFEQNNRPQRLPAKQETIDGWRAMALNSLSGGGIKQFETEQPFHRSAKTSLLAAALYHDQVAKLANALKSLLAVSDPHIFSVSFGVLCSLQLASQQLQRPMTGRSFNERGLGIARRAKTAAVPQRATVEKRIAAEADIGWSHCLRGQKW
jgi:hypothetical protein